MLRAVSTDHHRAQPKTAGNLRTATQIQQLAEGFSIETTPRQAQKIESFAACLPLGTKVFIALIPGESLTNMVALAERLLRDGMCPVPHVPARSLDNFEIFEGYLGKLAAAGVDQALVLAGGLRQPVGDLTDSMQLLASGAFERHGFKQLYVAGHPEGSPDISAAELARAIAFKNNFAEQSGIPLTLTTQFSFDAQTVMDWSLKIAAEGNQLPVRIGIPGPASVTALLKYAKMCGVSASASMLKKAGGKLFQLVGQAAPDGMISTLASSADQEAIAGLHLYPFGGFAKNAQWMSSVSQGDFVLHPKGSGFTVQD